MKNLLTTTGIVLLVTTAAFSQTDNDLSVPTEETGQVTDNASDLTIESQEATDAAQQDAIIDNEDTVVEQEVDGGMRDGDATTLDLAGVMAETLINAPVYADNGDEVGTVDQLIMDDTGIVSGVIVASGGFLGFGEKRALLGPDMLRVEDDNEAYRVMLTMSEGAFSELPNYES